LNHLTKTTSTRASRRCATVLTPSSLVSDKTYRGRVCYRRHTQSSKTLKYQYTRATAIVKVKNHRLEESDLQPTPANTNADSIPGDPLGRQTRHVFLNKTVQIPNFFGTFHRREAMVCGTSKATRPPEMGRTRDVVGKGV
jgi:hypothetical protein